MARKPFLVLICAAALLLTSRKQVSAQYYGSDLHNALQPASGGLAGTSLAAPQDAPSAVFGNPATFTQFEGTTFTFGGSYIEPTLSVSHDGFVTTPLGGGPWQGKSEAEPLLLPSIAVLQDMRGLGVAGTLGAGFTALSGSATSFRNQPNSVGASSEYVLPAVNAGAAIEVAERFSIGATVTVGLGLLDANLDRSTGAIHDMGFRGTFGASFDVSKDMTLGAYYQTRMAFEYDDLFRRANGAFQSVKVDQPENIGVGVANRSFLGGNLMLAADVVYKFWDRAAFWNALYENQWAFSAGAQLCLGRIVLRGGYAYADNPIRSDVGFNLGGVLMPLEATRYIQATQAAAIYRHRVSAGLGMKNLLPNMDLDLFLGQQFREGQDFGVHTHASVTTWYAGFGLTWHFGCKQ